MKKDKISKTLKAGLRFVVQAKKEGVSLKEVIETGVNLDEIELLISDAAAVGAAYSELRDYDKMKVVLEVLDIESFPKGLYYECWEVVETIILIYIETGKAFDMLKKNSEIWLLISK